MVETALLLRTLGILVAVGVVALLIHVVLFQVAFRYWRTPFAVAARRHARWPARTTTVLLSLIVAVPFTQLPEDGADRVNHALTVLLVLATAWLVIRLVFAAEDSILSGLDLETADNLRARRRKTQIVVIRRATVAAVSVLAVAGILLTFDTARSVGASLLASAGILGIVAGVAAQSTLGDMIAGLQIAFAEPIRLGDVVVVEGEWGHVEEIKLTHVVVRLWDLRRLVLPTSYFTKQPFQNWTHSSSQVLGQISLWLDPRTSVGPIRAQAERLAKASDRWDGEVVVTQVADTTEATMQVRVLVSARDAPTAWDLRCELREGLLAFVRSSLPEALPVLRVEPGPGGPTDDAEIEDVPIF